MQILKIQSNYQQIRQNKMPVSKNTTPTCSTTNQNDNRYINYYYREYNISFGESNTRNLTIPDIDYEEYQSMSEATKRRFRKRYNEFTTSNIINKNELIDPKYQYLPLRSENLMDKFIEITNVYSKFKDNQIICLGRSPKWFLNTSLWMNEGIDDYKFVAFSGYWYRPDSIEGLSRMNAISPKQEDIDAYRKYLKRIKADPQSIVEKMQKEGKKTVITDYIHSGKGACSFMEIMGNFAKDQGVLEEFSKSIQIVGIGSRAYLEEMNPYAESISDPRVIMPEVLWPYERNIKQEFHDMDYNVFCEMLLNQNSNECRSTYYPSNAWSIYKPDKFKTGLIKDLKKVKDMIKLLPHNKSVSSFNPAMRDYRNLLNFRILDGLNARGLLKTVHKSKI